jgi:hypothetical protein
MDGEELFYWLVAAAFVIVFLTLLFTGGLKL